MATVTTVPVEVYLRSSYEPDAEYVDGVIEARPTGEYDHAAWQEAILAYFRNHRQEWNIRALPELRVKISQTRYRVPDVTVLDRALPIEQIITVPPIAVFEILSPDDTMSRILVKLADYENMGISNIFVVEPTSDTQYFYAKGCLERMCEPIMAGPCRIDFAEIKKNIE
jgi:Uma2 family endonuclease